MPVVDIQRQSQQIGRIRIGQKVAASNGGTRPAKLDTFRFTTPSRRAAEEIARLYGGQVRPWEKGQFEVVTSVAEIEVMVPPRNAVVSQWYEMWNAGGCVRRCTGQVEQISGGRCLCPHAEDTTSEDEVRRAALRRKEMAASGKACKLVTRINVMLPDVPGLGVFRLDTGSFYAAAESGDKADLMEMAREQGIFLRAALRIEKRQRVANGRTTEYPVPVLEILPTFRQIATGELAAAGIAAALPPAPAAVAAITAGTAPAPAPRARLPESEPEMTAQDIYALACTAMSRAAIEDLIRQANDLRIAGDLVCTDRDADAWGELTYCLRGMWKDLPRGGGPGE